MGRPTAAYLVQDDFAHRGSLVSAGVGAERRQHSCDQAFVALYSYLRQAPMAQEPIPEAGQV
jgi:hypothetical protein